MYKKQDNKKDWKDKVIAKKIQEMDNYAGRDDIEEQEDNLEH